MAEMLFYLPPAGLGVVVVAAPAAGSFFRLLCMTRAASLLFLPSTDKIAGLILTACCRYYVSQTLPMPVHDSLGIVVGKYTWRNMALQLANAGVD